MFQSNRGQKNKKKSYKNGDIVICIERPIRFSAKMNYRFKKNTKSIEYSVS